MLGEMEAGVLSRRTAGVDQIELPEHVPGGVWSCGKHAIAPDRERLLGPIRRAVDRWCRLVERRELACVLSGYCRLLHGSDGRRLGAGSS